MRIGLVASLAAWTLLAAPAQADEVFDFSGVCGVTCTGNATGVLTLSDSYVFGSVMTSSDVLSLTYSSTTFADSLIPGGSAIVIGGLNADGTIPFTGTLEIMNSGGFFFDIGGGGWKTTNGSVGDFGTDPVLTPVPTTSLPEPSVLWMLLLIAPGLWYLARRARRR